MKSQPIHVFAKWTLKPGNLDKVLKMLKDLHERSIEEKGNLFYKVFLDNSDQNIIVLYEGYADAQALALHRSAPYYIETVIEKMPAFLAGREVHLTTPAVL